VKINTGDLIKHIRSQVAISSYLDPVDHLILIVVWGSGISFYVAPSISRCPRNHRHLNPKRTPNQPIKPTSEPTPPHPNPQELASSSVATGTGMWLADNFKLINNTVPGLLNAVNLAHKVGAPWARWRPGWRAQL